MKLRATEYPKSNTQQGEPAAVSKRPFAAPIKLLAILMAVLLIAVLVGCGSLPQEMPQSASPAPTSPVDPPTPSTGETTTPTLMDAVTDQTRHWLGEADAPVTIIEFGDFQ